MPYLPVSRGGVILDIPTGMTHVACKVVEFPGPESAAAVEPERGIPGLSEELFPLHVLVVDDEPLIRWSIAESLANRGMDVEQAEDAASALRTVTTTAEPFQVIILDLRLPDMTDLSLLATLRQLLPSAKLILMTAFGTPEIVQQAALIGAKILNKPFELSELDRLVGAAGPS